MVEGVFRKMCSEGHRLLFFDLYIALLFKYKEKDVIITLVSNDVQSSEVPYLYTDL